MNFSRYCIAAMARYIDNLCATIVGDYLPRELIQEPAY